MFFQIANKSEKKCTSTFFRIFYKSNFRASHFNKSLEKKDWNPRIQEYPINAFLIYLLASKITKPFLKGFKLRIRCCDGVKKLWALKNNREIACKKCKVRERLIEPGRGQPSNYCIKRTELVVVGPDGSGFNKKQHFSGVVGIEFKRNSRIDLSMSNLISNPN